MAALVGIVMAAFAANSVIGRAALDGGGIGAADYATIRFVAGAATLLAVAALRGARVVPRGRTWLGAAGLGLYAYGFAAAYVTLDAGAGALILFGAVQVAMFGAAALAGGRPPGRRWAGAAIALGGLALIAWQGGAGAPDARGAALMAAAGLGWAAFTLVGRSATDPLGETAGGFAIVAAGGLAWTLAAGPGPVSASGAALAAVSGAATSGLGYALWYAVLPRLEASAAGLAQMAVPVLAILGGAAILGEAPGARVWLACAAISGGVALGLVPPRRGWRGRGAPPRSAS